MHIDDLKNTGRPLSLDDIIDVIDSAPVDYMSDPRNSDRSFSFVANGGRFAGNQIDISVKPVESDYEAFDGVADIYENGVPVLYTDAMSVGAYHNEVYTRSSCHSMEEAIGYLKEKYSGVEFEMTDVPLEIQHFSGKEASDMFQWSDPVYRRKKQIEAQGVADVKKPHSADLERFVFKDEGVVSSGDFRKVVVAKACDKLRIGKDDPVVNPYVVNKKVWTHDNVDGGSKPVLRTEHAVLLRPALYDRLMQYANCNGLKDSIRWTGVINGRLTGDEKGLQMIDLSRNGTLERPDEAFDESRHDKYVKVSLARMNDREVVSPKVNRRVVNLLDDTGASDDFELGG